MEALPIETERLLLRQFAVEDAEDVFAIFSDEQTTLDCGGYHAFDAMDDEYRRLMQKFAGQMRYSIVEKETGRVVGVISMMDAERRCRAGSWALRSRRTPAGTALRGRRWRQWSKPILPKPRPCCSRVDTMPTTPPPENC